MVSLTSWPGIGLVAVVTFALTALSAVLSLGALPAVIAIFGWFMVVPVLAILTYYDEDADESAETDPLAMLRERYARGELTEAEFERRLDRLLETEDIETAPNGSDGTTARRAEREPVRER